MLFRSNPALRPHSAQNGHTAWENRYSDPGNKGRNKPRPARNFDRPWWRGRRAVRWGCVCILRSPSLITANPLLARKAKSSFSSCAAIAASASRVPLWSQGRLVSPDDASIRRIRHRAAARSHGNHCQGTEQNFPKPLCRSDVFLHLLCIRHVRLTSRKWQSVRPTWIQD